MPKRSAEEAFADNKASKTLEDSAKEAFEDDWKEKEVKNKLNSLDSDEEDEGDGDGENYEILEEDDIEGQEEGGVGLEGDIQLTPFNMKEELEEGHFDTDGMYHWNKEKEVKDHWLDNINWVKVEPKSNEKKEDEATPEIFKPLFDHLEAYGQLLALMKPKESVAKALRRLGGNKTLSASERWKKKKAEKSAGTSGDGAGDDDKTNVNTMTELASNILTHTGNMDIYQETYEQIEARLDQARSSSGKPNAPAAHDDLDMYADDFDVKEKQKLGVSESTVPEDTSQPSESTSTLPSTAIADSVSSSRDSNSEPQAEELRWEFKRSKDEMSSVEGPYSSAQMQKWTEEGKFSEEIWVRKVGTSGEFYSNRRVDFELYL